MARPKRGITAAIDDVPGPSPMLAFRFGKRNQDKLEALATRAGRTRSEMARAILEQYFRNQESVDAALGNKEPVTLEPATPSPSAPGVEEKIMKLENRINELELAVKHKERLANHWKNNYWQMRDVVGGLGEVANRYPDLWIKAFRKVGADDLGGLAKQHRDAKPKGNVGNRRSARRARTISSELAKPRAKPKGSD